MKTECSTSATAEPLLPIKEERTLTWFLMSPRNMKEKKWHLLVALWCCSWGVRGISKDIRGTLPPQTPFCSSSPLSWSGVRSAYCISHACSHWEEKQTWPHFSCCKCPGQNHSLCSEDKFTVIFCATARCLKHGNVTCLLLQLRISDTGSR